MVRDSTDRDGRHWRIVWGVSNPEEALRDHFGCAGPFAYVRQTATFSDPLYPDESKTLSIYTTPSGRNVAMAEITPGVYAAGVLLGTPDRHNGER